MVDLVVICDVDQSTDQKLKEHLVEEPHYEAVALGLMLSLVEELLAPLLSVGCEPVFLRDDSHSIAVFYTG